MSSQPHDDGSSSFRPWEGDHTDLVRLLNAARAKGLSLLGSDADELAELILQSRWLAAREAHAVTAAGHTDQETGREDTA